MLLPLCAKEELTKNLITPKKQEQPDLQTIVTTTTIKKLQPLNAITKIPISPKAPKEWTIIVYFAANNNLHKFAKENLRQLLEIGSSNLINIVVQTDMSNSKEIQRMYIEKNNAHIIQKLPFTEDFISGTPASLYNCIEWAIKNYPAKEYAIIIWNHGSGPIDPIIWGKLSENYNFPCNLKKLTQAKEQNPLEITREVLRGTAFNDQFQTYLTNPEQKTIFNRISKNLLNGEKIALVVHDACNQGALEVASEIKDAAKIMVASEEIELATGFNYKTTLDRITKESLTPEEFAQEIVVMYQNEYQNMFADLTLSAIDLTKIPLLESNIDEIAELLIMLLASPYGTRFKKFLTQIRKDYDAITMFYNQDLIDLGHFYQSLSTNLAYFHKISELTPTIKILQDKLILGLILIKQVVLKNAVGKNVAKAQGLSIYFPRYNIHSSYQKLSFAQTTKWLLFLKRYLSKPI